MPHDFDLELLEILAKRLPFEEQEKLVHELLRRHGREVLPPITGTLKATDPKDRFGGG